MGATSLLNGVALGVRNCAYGERLAAGAVVWCRILHRDDRNTTREMSNAGRVDHHNMEACCDVLGGLGLESLSTDELPGRR